jgi:hypothetical protein
VTAGLQLAGYDVAKMDSGKKNTRVNLPTIPEFADAAQKIARTAKPSLRIFVFEKSHL